MSRIAQVFRRRAPVAGGGGSRRATAPRWLALGATALALLAGYLLKAQCARMVWVDASEYVHLCYNDIQPLFHHRGIAQDLLPYRDIQVEYPVLTGTFMYLAGRLLRWITSESGVTDGNYFHLTSILLAPFAFAITLLLRPHVTRGRLLLWAAGTPLVLYAFHNWDLLAVAGAVAGLAALERRRDAHAGAALALGASAKLYPAFLLPGALLGRWAEGERRAAGRILAWFVVAAAAANVPWMLISWEGWKGVWSFHADRYPDFGTVWFWIAHHGRRLVPAPWWEVGNTGYRDLVSAASLVLFASGSLWFLWVGWRRRAEAQGYPVAATGLGIIALFLLVSKIHSPQYALWLAPLLALLDVPWRLVLAYYAADLALYVSGFYWFTVFSAPAPAWKGIFEVTVLGRAAVLGALAWWAIRAVRVAPDAGAAELAGPGAPRRQVALPSSRTLSSGAASNDKA